MSRKIALELLVCLERIVHASDAISPAVPREWVCFWCGGDPLPGPSWHEPNCPWVAALSAIARAETELGASRNIDFSRKQKNPLPG